MTLSYLIKKRIAIYILENVLKIEPTKIETICPDNYDSKLSHCISFKGFMFDGRYFITEIEERLKEL